MNDRKIDTIAKIVDYRFQNKLKVQNKVSPCDNIIIIPKDYPYATFS